MHLVFLFEKTSSALPKKVLKLYTLYLKHYSLIHISLSGIPHLEGSVVADADVVTLIVIVSRMLALKIFYNLATLQETKLFSIMFLINRTIDILVPELLEIEYRAT